MLETYADLAKAIRAGIPLSPIHEQGGLYLNRFHDIDGQVVFCACALGTAALAELGTDSFPNLINVSGKIDEWWCRQPIARFHVSNPHSKANPESLFDVIITLNDVYNWSREHICDWLESLEQPS